MDNEYKIGTLQDIMNLEDDQIERFCAELPRHIKYIKAIVDFINESGGDGETVAETVFPFTWIDDGKQDITASLTHGGEEFGKIVVTKDGQQ